MQVEEDRFTFNQIKMFGGKVIKGEKSHLIVYWNWQEKVNRTR
jgi:antirestriction protein ArdC